ncbi:MAG TPA: dihydrofolate reductase family protein [Gaiella sp.]|nr:dihydrofolate reductase family protein [Gaiella sp.]
MSELEPFAVLHAGAGQGLALPSSLHRVYGGDLALPERCVYANFVATVDGVVAIPSVAGSNRAISGGSEADRFLMGTLRAAADLVLIGSGTLRASPEGRWRPETVYLPGAAAFADLRRQLGCEPSPRVAILTASGAVPADHPVLAEGALVVTTSRGAEALGERLPAEAELAVLPGDAEVDVRAALDLLRRRGYGRILSEAGPHVFGSLVESDLVDELFLTVSPLLAGRGVSVSYGLVEGAALLPGRTEEARLRSVRLHGSHLFLHYGLST